ncbi:hypothetical protein Acor_66930 [Acrocarpospora corrugata]|uniref:Uncharacterized protein n=1 Tax=Acrocarpospora corrugata TaxID=35763 RepID=A0A5M3W6I0_9ACTN|nr:hypothetical protein [Acrocarpospora corrugata]GES04625.1 hypothetical protein Acor_66930 [Acrocarpospora corrugata]
MTTHPPLTTQNKIGLVLAAALALADLGLTRTGLAIGFDFPDLDVENQPNLPLIWGGLIISSVPAITTLVAIVYTWLTANRIGSRIIAGARVLSLLLTIPIFFAIGMDEYGHVFGLPIVPFTAGHVLITIITVILVLSRPTAAPLRPGR